MNISLLEFGLLNVAFLINFSLLLVTLIQIKKKKK